MCVCVRSGLKSEFWLFNSMDFCKDLANWTSLIMETQDAPLVHSVSYGWQGDLKQVQCEPAKSALVDDNFAKLATMGITIIFASGDSGSGYSGDSPSGACTPGSASKGMAYKGTVLKTTKVRACRVFHSCVRAYGCFICPHRSRSVVQHAFQSECCDEASDLPKAMAWSFKENKKGKGKNKPGTCIIYSAVTRSFSDPKSISGQHAKPKLWPSW